MSAYFISEVSSNHGQSLERSIDFIEKSAAIGCDAVKFQLFKVDQLFAPEILSRSPEHQRRAAWELPLSFLPDLAKKCQELDIDFSCTPFYLEAVETLEPYVDFYKIASYELLWDDLIKRCAATGKPVILSTGMANFEEIDHAVEIFNKAGGKDLTLLHCVSGYPTPLEDCNLSALEVMRGRYGGKIGWSDHSRNPHVIERSIHRWNAEVIEFHLDIDEQGAEYEAGHCWLPNEMASVIKGIRLADVMDGVPLKQAAPSEFDDRQWRADPSDGLRPMRQVRREWQKK